MSEKKTYDKSKLIRYYSDSADDSFEHVSNKSPERAWIFALTKEFWNNAFRGKDEGKKIIYVNAGAPVELVYAFGAVPLLLDMVATRTATEPDLAAKYVDAAERLVPNSMCGITKVPYAASILGEMEIPPDAMMYSTVPCDSSRISTVAITKHFGVPAFNLDVPFQANDRGYRYMAEQYREAIPFLEGVTGNKFDPDRFRECAALSNRATELMWDIAKLRMHVPCPLPGLILYANQAIPCMAGTRVLVDYMETQCQMAQFLVASNMSAALGAEKYRIFWMQNMLWSNIKLLSWLEKEFGAVVVMEAFGYQKGPVFENPDDLGQIFYDLARKTLALPM
ncbi:MAG: 2-hydroxyacyl-CoA dehydratase family protein, partial [Clostridiales Family XIII bacterium]|nr:2-hydroxyacyl-CoA dehydratase family protein [Clostridiales Family XIII bacterium]